MSDIDYKKLRKQAQEIHRKGSFPFPSYAEALFSQVLISRKPIEGVWEKPKVQGPTSVSHGPEVAGQGQPQKRPSPDQESSEQKDLIRSFGKFIDDQPEPTGSGEKKVAFQGGEVVKKGDLQGDQVLTLSDFETKDSEPDLIDDLNDKTKVLFVGEKPKDFQEEEPNKDLLSKMIAAMNLKSEDFCRVFITKDKDKAESEWIKLLKDLPSEENLIVVSLGAMATNVILGKKERLSRIHGKEVKIVIKERSQLLSVYPVFHPDILQINPNMKRSAWLDLQKVMEKLNQS